MKQIKNLILLALFLFSTFAFLSCSSTEGTFDGGGAMAGGASSGIADASVPNGEESSISIPAGQMTAAAWNDNENYLFWQGLFSQDTEGAEGKFFGYSGGDAWGFNSLGRVCVSVTHGGNPVSGAKVYAKSESGRHLFEAVTDAAGRAYIFTEEKQGKVYLEGGEISAEFTNDVREVTLESDSEGDKRNVLEIMFVIDVTGSMGDELRYVEAEIGDVISKVSEDNDGAVINMALLFYRDYTDKEIFAYHDFVNVTSPEGLSSVISALENQSASGGGDYPEAVDEALAIAVSKQWSDAATTKLIFHILDAPPHTSEANRSTYKAAVDEAARRGIRICPILCSGADTLTEYITRQAAIYTGGTFIFVTDDSGIGGEHHDPDIPNATVELLNSMLIRLINGYHAGIFEEPIPWRNEVSPENPTDM